MADLFSTLNELYYYTMYVVDRPFHSHSLKKNQRKIVTALIEAINCTLANKDFIFILLIFCLHQRWFLF